MVTLIVTPAWVWEWPLLQPDHVQVETWCGVCLRPLLWILQGILIKNQLNNTRFSICLFQLKPQGSLCREPASDCDLGEFCSGKSGECPTDLYIKNGKTCMDTNGEQGFCFNGDCPTRTKQCQVPHQSSASDLFAKQAIMEGEEKTRINSWSIFRTCGVMELSLQRIIVMSLTTRWEQQMVIAASLTSINTQRRWISKSVLEGRITIAS